MKRALENLINNAFRYGDRVQLFCHLAQGQIVFEVHDNGPGIPNEKFGDALKPFHRLDPARNQNKGAGVGLGLPITEDIASVRSAVGWNWEKRRLGRIACTNLYRDREMMVGPEGFEPPTKAL